MTEAARIQPPAAPHNVAEQGLPPEKPANLRFDDLIAPLDRDTFFADYWEKKPFVSKGKRANFFSGLFCTRDVDDFIVRHKPRPGHLDLVSNHGFVADNFLNADGTANINLVYQNYLKGSTVILSGLEHSWPALSTYCRHLEGDLNHKVGVATYMTPPDTAGVKPHFDTQEGFLVQVDGSKRWLVYAPLQEAPPVEGSYSSVDRALLGEPILDEVIEAGDVLYIPRGFPHEGVSGAGVASLHITLEVHVRCWYDFMSDALKALADRDTRFRRSVPVGFLNDDAAQGRLEEGLAYFKQLFAEQSSVEDAMRKHMEEVIVDHPPNPDGHFATLHAPIDGDTRLKKRQVAATRLFEENGMAGMQFSGNHIAGPAKIAPALAYIRTADIFTPSDLPDGLTSKEQLVLVNRLIRIGLLTLA